MNLQEKTIPRDINSSGVVIEGRLLYEKFIESAGREPDKTAVSWMENGSWVSMTYGNLMDKAIYLAGYLQMRGVRAKENVAVSLPRGGGQVIAVLGILVAGGVYVPIGSEQPDERKRKIFERGNIRFCISEKELPGSVEAIDLKSAVDDRYIPTTPDISVDDLAYIIFTSGTTGEPKGVMISHDGAWNTIEDVNQKFNIGEGDCAISVSALDFDLSVYDIFGMLGAGGSLIMIPEEKSREALFWYEVLKEYKVTVWNSVPALFDMVLSCWEDNPADLSLKTVMVSGDWVMPQLVERAFKIAPDLKIFALGGATEASIWSSYYPVKSLNSEWKSVPYGRPLGNQQIRVTDDEGMDCEDGVQGNIWLGGRGVAKGYLGDSELTADRFINLDGVPWYYTGDTGRYDENHDIEFLGRKDRQVKLNGYRIEIGEIEHNAAKIEGVADNFAMIIENGGAKQLALAYTPESSVSDKDEVQGFAGIKPDQASDKAIALFMRDIFNEYPELRDSDIRVVESWKRWLELHEDSSVAADSELLKELSQIKEAVADTVTGRRDPLWLLDHPYFSIDHLFFKDEGIVEGLEYMVAEVNSGAAEKGSLKVAVMDVRGDLIPDYLLKRLPDNSELTCIVRGAGEKERAGKIDEKLKVIYADGDLVPEGSEFSFDILIALNTMHQYRDAEEGPAFAYTLLKPGGRLLMMEQNEFPPIGLVTSALLEKGFKEFKNRKEPFSPMLKSEEWGTILNAKGFVSVEATRMSDTATVILEARVNKRDQRIKPEDLQEFLRVSVPGYMVPETIRMVYRVGLTGNGKVDVGAIKKLMDSMPQEEFVMPDGETEIQVADLWKEILGIAEVGRNSSFFQLGGDSLLATRFLNKINKIYNFTYSLREMFDNPVLMDVAASIDSNREDLLMEEGVI